MASLIVGFISLVMIVVVSIKGDVGTYLQAHSILIVLGGTSGILLLSTPNTVLKALWRSLLGMFKTDISFANLTSDLGALAKKKSAISASAHPLIQYALQLWESGTDNDLFIPLLSQRRRELEVREMEAVFALKNLSKYPPTLGMVGTVMGMITLFANLDTAKDKIGSSLSIAMTATLMGLILANMVISPLADRLHVRQVSQQRLLDHVYEILLLIHRGEPASLIGEEMKDRAA